MASVLSKDIISEYNMFGELFVLYKKYYHPEKDTDWWDEMMTAFRDLSNKYKTELCKDLCVACILDIESRYKI